MFQRVFHPSVEYWPTWSSGPGSDPTGQTGFGQADGLVGPETVAQNPTGGFLKSSL